MDSQLTLRLPRDLDEALARAAQARGVKKSQVVREAVAAYVAGADLLTPEEVWERSRPFAGVVAIPHEEAMQDPLYRQIYENNFRD